MPNLIEQQDLLKGLTDDRLSGLLKNPVGGIPPFLVAAEAQRRQAIRQQYAGQDQQESVVDTLTKQLSNMPQNAQPSPAAPQPQQGIAAIPQQEQQTMRDGGPVQRYAEKGLVEESYFPSFGDFFPSFKAPTTSLEDMSNMSLDEYLAAEEEKKYAPGVGGSKARYLRENPVVPKTELQAAQDEAYAATHGIGSLFSSPESRYEAVQNIKDKQASINAATRPVTEPRDTGIYGDKVPTASSQPKEPRNVNAGKAGTSEENKLSAAEDDIRKRLEALYGEDGGSKWDDAQKWFAVSQQFLKPDTSLLESLVGAGQVYSAASAEEAQADRDRKREEALAMLQYDIGERDASRSAAANEADFLRKQALELAKEDRAWQRKQQEMSTTRPGDVLQYFSSSLAALTKKLEGINDLPISEEQKASQRAIIQNQIDALNNQAGTMLSKGGYGLSVTDEELNS